MSYLVQKAGENITNTVNNSSLPSNIPSESSHFANSGRFPKFPVGPIDSPSPGPTLDIAEAEPDKAVIKSSPFKERIVDKIKKIKK